MVELGWRFQEPSAEVSSSSFVVVMFLKGRVSVVPVRCVSNIKARRPELILVACSKSTCFCTRGCQHSTDPTGSHSPGMFKRMRSWTRPLELNFLGPPANSGTEL